MEIDAGGPSPDASEAWKTSFIMPDPRNSSFLASYFREWKSMWINPSICSSSRFTKWGESNWSSWSWCLSLARQASSLTVLQDPALLGKHHSSKRYQDISLATEGTVLDREEQWWSLLSPFCCGPFMIISLVLSWRVWFHSSAIQQTWVWKLCYYFVN